MFGRKRKDRPKIGDYRVTVVQEGIALHVARAEQYGTQCNGLSSWKGWDTIDDSKQLHAPYETIINYFEATTAEEACAAAHHLIDVTKVRRRWAASRKEC